MPFTPHSARRVRVAVPTLLVAVGFAASAGAASTATPLTIKSLSLAGLPSQPFPGELLSAEARITTTSSKSVTGGRYRVYVSRRATTRPTTTPLGSNKINPVRRGKPVVVTTTFRLRKGASGSYYVIGCVSSKGHRRACKVYPRRVSPKS